MTDAEFKTYLIKNFGVDIGADGKYYMADVSVGLTDTEKNSYEHIPTSDRETYKHNCLNAKYGEDFLSAGYSDDPKVQQMMDEFSLTTRATSAGYLNMLSADDRTALINKYLDWQSSHSAGVYGYTDAELNSLSAEERDLIESRTDEAWTTWQDANTHDLTIWETDMNLIDGGIEMAEQDTNQAGTTTTSAIDYANDPHFTAPPVSGIDYAHDPKFTAPETQAENESSTADASTEQAETAEEKDSEQAGGTKSFWDGIVAGVTSAFLAAKEFIDEKAIPWFNEHVLHKEAEMVDNAEKTAEGAEQQGVEQDATQASNGDGLSAAEREQQRAYARQHGQSDPYPEKQRETVDIDYGDAGSEAEYQG